MIEIMNNKVEIFKLALKAGPVELTQEQSKFAIECFIKAQKLSGEGSPWLGAPLHHHKVSKELTGRYIFIKEKMAELKANGEDYQKNKASAQQAWNQLTVEEKGVWDKKAISVGHK